MSLISAVKLLSLLVNQIKKNNQMKKIVLLSIMQVCLFFSAHAQVLNVNNNEQLYNQWCWAGCSKTILDYYGYSSIQQCDIAEWVRTTATFHNFGGMDCCIDATQGCNYWNYNWGYAGSIQDILYNFGSIQSTGGGTLTQAEITTEIQNNKLFVIRWGWSTGGGHFIVGHGIIGNNIYFMNPWFGEGLHIGTYNFVNSGIDNTSTATHTWTHTNILTSIVSSVNEFDNVHDLSVFPNPFTSSTRIQIDNLLQNATLTIYNSLGQEEKQIKNISGKYFNFSRDELARGLYFILLTQDNKILAKNKIIITEK